MTGQHESERRTRVGTPTREYAVYERSEVKGRDKDRSPLELHPPPPWYRRVTDALTARIRKALTGTSMRLRG